MWQKLKLFVRENSGGAFVLAGFAALILVMALGMSVDVARAMMVRAKLQTALDAAGLAGGTKIAGEDMVEIRKMATKYFDANFPDRYMGANVSELEVTQNEETGEIAFTVSATLDMLFMPLIGVEAIDLAVDNAIKREVQKLEVALVLDQTGSMRGEKMTAMIDAAKLLVNSIYDESSNEDDTYFSITPYVATVNIGNSRSRLNWLVDRFSFDDMRSYGYADVCAWHYGDISFIGDTKRGTYQDNAPLYNQISAQRDDDMVTWSTANILNSADNRSLYFPGVWKGCVEARGALGKSNSGADDVWNDTTDAPPSDGVAGRWRPYISIRCDQHSGGFKNRWGYEWINDTYPGRNDEPIWGDASADTLSYVPDGTRVVGPNVSCGDPIMMLTNKKETVINKIESLVPWDGGGTMTNLGLAWGFRTISPRWNGLWPEAPALPSTAPQDEVKKVLVVLTDGQNAFWPNWKPFDYTAYGRLDEGVLPDGQGKRIGQSLNNGNTQSHQDRARAELNKRTAETCENIKKAGITVYAITFDVDSLPTSESTEIQSLFRNCATNPNFYFDSPDSEALGEAFSAIAQSISQLRLSQ